MKTSALLSTICLLLAVSAAHSRAEPVWATGSSLLEVIGYDIKAHDSKHKLTDYQTNAVCLLLGYFAGFVEASAVSSHYDATALPFFLPDNITIDEIERVVYKYLGDNPDKLNVKGDAIIVAALAKEFPNLTFKPPPDPAK